MIRVAGLHYSYPQKEALRGIDFGVAAGEVLALLGPNGAGKSTTLKLLLGQLDLQAGSIELLGQAMPAGRQQVQARIGVAFEEKNLYSAMTGRENLKFFAELFGVTPNLNELLERVDLAGRADDRVTHYSKGMRQRLMVARSLVNAPDLLLLDEPTDGLDPVSARKIRALIRAEAARGAAIVLTTHDMHEADELCDRVAFMNEGEILLHGEPQQLKLAHGARRVRLSYGRADGVEQAELALDGDGARAALQAAIGDPELLTVHTEEATLEQLFIAVAGRGLGG
jgi:ABC-type multidrug transport system ATPase subunit